MKFFLIFSEANEESSKESDEEVLGVLKKEDSSQPNTKDEIRESSSGNGPKSSDADSVVHKASDGKEKSGEDKDEKETTMQRRRLEKLQKDPFNKAYSHMKNVVWKELRDLGVDPSGELNSLVPG